MLQTLYHAVSLVGTLLLQLGEVGQKFDKRRPSLQDSSHTVSLFDICFRFPK
jgi:hypothetical protein